ncbi:WbqC family protein [Pseudoalteromonas sp. SMS1]|uniref:WbqC family protein n=1 Tax=Pseudoalteromonas sp. SMS1 TaxID=2908894 RepID=UPI001F2E67FD|nr:WbqC family protein [Pseudoalteromonas sp. SMS1]MCF2859373.1 WbqC family protein [Pseudoalteromonas sp. SMS1]
MILSVMQPTYIPWMGYFDLILNADKFVFLDDVKLEKSDWHVRNRVKSSQGELLLSQVVSTPKGRMASVICETSFKSGHPWRVKHLKSFKTNYAKAAHFQTTFDVIEAYYNTRTDNLAEFNIGLIKLFMSLLEINTPCYRASQLPNISGVKDERLANLCQYFGADNYVSPQGARNYIDKTHPGGALAKSGIQVGYQQFEHPNYPQLYGEFVSHLGIIDALFNVGAERTRELIEKGHSTPIT